MHTDASEGNVLRARDCQGKPAVNAGVCRQACVDSLTAERHDILVWICILGMCVPGILQRPTLAVCQVLIVPYCPRWSHLRQNWQLRCHFWQALVMSVLLEDHIWSVECVRHHEGKALWAMYPNGCLPEVGAQSSCRYVRQRCCWKMKLLGVGLKKGLNFFSMNVFSFKQPSQQCCFVDMRYLYDR